jgi:HTH-type transcriptional regulator, glycine betaine synthesis regulator
VERPSKARRPAGSVAPALWASEVIVSDVMGRLIEFWGFKRNTGRIWTVLYLSPVPLTAQDLRQLLGLSSGSVSMMLAELARWGVVRNVWVHGDRRDHFAAEVHLWKMISRVLSEREKAQITAVADACEEALRFLETKRHSPDPNERQRADLQIGRIRTLHSLVRTAKKLLEGLLLTAKLDAGPLAAFLLGSARSMKR